MRYALAKALFTGAALLFVSAITLIATHWDTEQPWFYIGLVLVLLGNASALTGLAELRRRQLAEEFDAGYRVGYRAGRRTTAVTVYESGGHVIDMEGHRGGLPKTPVWKVAGHRQAARRPSPHQDGPAQRDREDLGGGHRG